ncbi:hypothetical protein K0M31_011155 [Melipona bicolor]|uniref:Gustatory receptor n=1 Tax=Melipona bicolor TaxID=60889 RepID=A0AA40KUM1_9HYME|nr:hypothetical protein K0M31_011155 [Melipona bicolor]
MDSYGESARIITILNHIAALRNFIDPRKNQFKFVCSWTWNIFLILMIAVVQFRADLYSLQKMPFNIERITYIFQYVTHAFGYTSTVIIGLYQSKNALRLMEQIDRVDENLKNLGIQIDYRHLFRHVKIVGLFWLLNAIIILGIFITWIPTSASLQRFEVGEPDVQRSNINIYVHDAGVHQYIDLLDIYGSPEKNQCRRNVGSSIDILVRRCRWYFENRRNELRLRICDETGEQDNRPHPFVSSVSRKRRIKRRVFVLHINISGDHDTIESELDKE